VAFSAREDCEMMQNATVNNHRVRILGFEDYLNNLRESLEGALGLTMALKSVAAKLGLQINVEKTKILDLLDIGTYQDEFD